MRSIGSLARMGCPGRRPRRRRRPVLREVATAPPRAGGRAQSCSSCPETSSTSSSSSTMPRSGRIPALRGPAPTAPVVSRVVKLLAASERGVIVAGGGVLRARASKTARRRSRRRWPCRSWRRGAAGRLPERPPQLPRHDRAVVGADGPSAPRGRRCRRLHRVPALSEPTTFDYAIPAAGDAMGPRRSPASHRPCRARGARPSVSRRMLRRFLDAAWSDLRAAALDNETRHGARRATLADREAWRAASDVWQGTWERTGRPSRQSVVKTLRRSCRTTPRSRRMPATWAAGWHARLSLPSSGHVPRARRRVRWASGCPPAIAASLQRSGPHRRGALR